MRSAGPPCIIENTRTGKASGIDEGLSTITAGGVTQALLSPESWDSFIGHYYGGSVVNRHISEPIGTATAKERHYLVGSKPVLEDCTYRMLKPHEIQEAMAFDNEYIVLGNSRDRIKQLGNAVTPPVMEMLVERCIESLS